MSSRCARRRQSLLVAAAGLASITAETSMWSGEIMSRLESMRRASCKLANFQRLMDRRRCRSPIGDVVSTSRFRVEAEGLDAAVEVSAVDLQKPRRRRHVSFAARQRLAQDRALRFLA